MRQKTKMINPVGSEVIHYRSLSVMKYRNNKIRSSRGLTLVEMLIAMTIMAIIFAAILPQFRVIQNSWDTKAGSSEALQNGRVLIDHLNRNLSKAAQITAVSGPSETNGYIEFMDNDANNLRYDIDNIGNYVEFGPVGSLYDLAGPVSQLLFTCYDGNDFTTPITDVNSIRFIKMQTILNNPSAMGQDKAFSTSIYLRACSTPGDGSLIGWWKLDETLGVTASDSSGNGNDGTLVLMNPASDWVTGKIGGGLDFDGSNDYVNCGHDASVNITGAVTVSAWIKLTAVDIDQKVAGNQDGIAGGYKMAVYSNNKVEFEIRDSVNNETLNRNEPGGTVLTTGVWYHVAGVYSQEGNYIRTYVNGNLDRSMSTASVLGSTSGDLKFGREPFGSLYFFHGLLDDVRIYNRALNPEEVADLAGGVFQQDEGSNGLVSMEAEHYTINASQGGHQWDLVVSPADYSDEGAMEATPDSGTNQDTDYAANSPRLDFLVNFVKTGTHYVWVRGYDKDDSADSCHAGLDGQEISTCDRMNNFFSFYWWRKETMDGPDATFDVSTAGIHTFNIWMREDGFVIDKIVLTNNASYIPLFDGFKGPAESEQSEPGAGEGGGLFP